VHTWREVEVAIGTRPNRELAIRLQRDGQTMTVNVRSIAEGRYEMGDIGILPDVSPSVRSVVPGDPADRAGVKTGDVIFAVNGQRVVFARHLAEAISKNAGRAIDLSLRRNSEVRHITVTPEKRGDRGLIGISISEATKSFKPGPFEALRLSVEQNAASSGLIFTTLAGLVTGETSVRQLQGPVGIAQLSGESAQAGWISLLSLMALISLNLGILNLMPVPILDGGHIMIMALEGIARRDFSMQVKEKMLLAGFVVLMMLMVTVIYNDLTRISWIERLMPWRN
jgi:regulator of sigma E protease